MENNIVLSSKPISISEHKDYKLGTFLISVLDEYNLNDVMIPKVVGEQYHSTIIGFPIVAKLITDENGNPVDFSGHQLSLVQDENGNTKVKFGTIAIGSVLSSWIEDRYMVEYNGVKSCIMIQAKLWSSRFPEYFTVLDKLWKENNVKSSWELSVEQAEKDTFGRRIIKAFSFIGNALLGSSVQGAVPKAGIYEYAELSDSVPCDIQLAESLSKDLLINNLDSSDINDINEEQGNSDLENELNINDQNQEVEDVSAENNEQEENANIDVESNGVENSDTENDLNSQIEILKSEIEEKNNALIKANEVIQTLRTEITELSQYKEKFEEVEQVRIANETQEKREEMKQYALKTKLISEKELTDNENIKNCIEAINYSELDNIILTRFMESIEQEVSTKSNKENSDKDVNNEQENTKINLSSADDDAVDPTSFMRSYIYS